LNSFDIPESWCPYCHTKQKQAADTPANGTLARPPSPGDLTVCESCLGPLTFGMFRQLEPVDPKTLTKDDLRSLVALQELVKRSRRRAQEH
jgi:hypothetical protein